MNVDAVIDFKHWRDQARQLLKQGIHPTAVNWSGQQQTQLAFDNPQTIAETTHSYASQQVPKNFIKLARAAACFRDENRWAWLYSVLWRLTHGEAHLLHLVTDPEVKRLRHMAQAVRRDAHKMHAFVRFKKQQINDREWYVSWFEPSHLIVPDTADFFVKRFNTMNWSILTPDACAHWDQNRLQITPGVDQPNALAQGQMSDDMDQYWLQYYRHIFNPARLKTQAMQSEMPKKYWDNLPEATLINDLANGSGRRTQTMLDQTPNDPDRLRVKSKKLRQQQDAIRSKQHPSNPVPDQWMN